MNALWQDTRYAFRMLKKSPGFTAVAVLTLAIGIGANIAMFSVVNGVLLRPLPFADSDRLVVVQQRSKQQGWTTGWSYPDFLDWREQNQVFEEFAAYTPQEFDLIESTGAGKINGAFVAGNFFSLLQTSACLGRTFVREDEQEGGERVAIVSHDFWRNRFGEDKTVLGRTITLNDRAHTIIGVLPHGFRYPEFLGDAQVWTVLSPGGDREFWLNRHNCWLGAVGRLKAGISMGQALPQLNEMHKRMTSANGTAQSEVLMYGLHEMVVRDVRSTLWILAAIVGFILFIVCANVANLCLTRASARDREMAIRGVLGADPLRLLRQCTTESLLLSLLGGGMGLIVATWATTIFKVRIADLVPMSNAIRLDPGVLLFGLGLSLLVGVLLGVTPFWFVQRSRPTNVLMERKTASRHHSLLSNAIIGAQIAMALVLSIGTTLMIRSILELSSTDTGFSPDNVIAFDVGIRRMNEQQRYQFAQVFLDRLRVLPNVKSVSTDSSMPCSPQASSAPVSVEGYTPPDGKPVRTVCHNISTDYFKTLQVSIRRGRDISPVEHQRKDPVVVVSESLARRFWPDRDPLGREVIFCRKSYQVIGVAADMIQGNVRIDKPNHLFLPFDAVIPDAKLKIVIRTQSDPASVIAQARAVLRSLDATLPLSGAATFKAQMNECISQERFTTAFLTFFAFIALLLIVVGIYGVVSYAVVQRTREIGIRMALGAPGTSILAMVLKQGLLLSVVGSAVGVIGALGLTRFLASYLYEVSATDPATFGLIPLLITGVSMLACWLPARRAARVDPMVALRCE